MSDQPKPTEWTEETVRMFGETCWNTESCKDVADAHNAALDKANVRETELICERDYFKGQVQQLRTQLAAERESHEKELDVVEKNWSEELAAEREKREAQGKAAERLKKEHHAAQEKLLDICEKLEQQLSSEREKCQPLVDALTNSSMRIGALRSFMESGESLSDGDRRDIANTLKANDAALAKVKEGKV